MNWACPICGRGIPKSQLLCLVHWRMVPRPLQERVGFEWSGVRAAKKPDVLLAVLKRHAAAKTAAIAAVRAQLAEDGNDAR